MTAGSGQDMNMRLTNARQTLSLLQSQLQSGRFDPAYLAQRMNVIGQMFDDLLTERQHSDDATSFAKLYEVSRMIGSSLDLGVVLNQVMDAIITLTEAERGFLMLLNDDGVLEVRVARNFDQETLESDEVVFSRTITRQVFESGEPIVTTNASEDPRYAGQASIVAHQLRSIMAAPLRARGAIIGVIYVDNRVRAALFRETDLELLEAFAGQAAVSIDNARLFNETDQQLAQRVDELTTLQWVDRQLNESLDANKAMQLTVEWAQRITKARTVSLAMLQKESNDLEIMSHAGEAEDVTRTQQHIPLISPLIIQALESGKTEIQVSNESVSDPETIMVVPIRLEQESIGVIIVIADRDNAFDEEAQALAARMADRAAIAIENARLYNEVKRANQAKSEFVGIVAHELKSPMTGISGYADLLMQFSNLDDKEMNYVQRIKGSVTRMQQLVVDLSDISRIESGNLRVEMVEVDLKYVLEEAKASTMAQIEERGHQLVEDIESSLPSFKADPARAVQVMVNLLSNAAKYTPDKGTITIRAYQENDRVMASVSDTGVGLSPEELEKLGTKFWRSSNDHTVKQRGTGLGFNITQNLLEAMQATLQIESEVNVGSTFTVGFLARAT